MDEVGKIFIAARNKRPVKIRFTNGAIEEKCELVSVTGDRFIIEPSESLLRQLNWYEEGDTLEMLECYYDEIEAVEIL